jgi:lysophospholipid acyltransferase (LPLAT)-like uncharacterized protein
MKVIIKKIFKSDFAQEILAYILLIYIFLVSITSYKKMEFEEGFSEAEFYNPSKTIFALWHQNLAISIIFFRNIGSKIRPLVSPHSDGMILGRVIEKYGCKNIYGSTNKDSIKSVKEIMNSINSGGNIVITPDGPKGPVGEVNSNILTIGDRVNARIIVVNFEVSKYHFLNTWDKMRIPLPFSKIIIKFSKPLTSKIDIATFKKYLDGKI